MKGAAAALSWSAGRSPHRRIWPAPPPPSFSSGWISGTPAAALSRWTAWKVAEVTLAITTRQPDSINCRVSAAPSSGSVASSATRSSTGRPRKPPSVFSSSTAILARFSHATANTAPGPDLLVSSPMRYAYSLRSATAGQPRRRISQPSPSSSSCAKTVTRVCSPGSRSNLIFNVPRHG